MKRTIIILLSLLIFPLFEVYGGIISKQDNKADEYLILIQDYEKRIHESDSIIKKQDGQIKKLENDLKIQKQMDSLIDNVSITMILEYVVIFLLFLLSALCIYYLKSLKSFSKIIKHNYADESDILLLLKKDLDQLLSQGYENTKQNNLLKLQLDSVSDLLSKKVVFDPRNNAINDAQIELKKPKIVPKANLIEKFYVVPQVENGNIILCIGDIQYKEYVPFILETKGKTGTVYFNSFSFSNIISNLEIELIPFANCEVLSQNPSSIITSNAGKAELRGDVWYLTDKPSLTIL